MVFLRRSLSGVFVAGLAAIQANVCGAEDARVLPVPSITIYPGDSIRDSWLVDRNFTANPSASRAGLIEARDAIVGKVARRTLLPGVPIPVTAVAEPRLVSNGEKVKVVFSDAGMTITTYGSALQSGGAGDVVSVRNLDSGLTISGVVQPDGSVRVSGG